MEREISEAGVEGREANSLVELVLHVRQLADGGAHLMDDYVAN